MYVVPLVVAAYLCGALPTGVWVGRLAGVDVQRSGSGNIGATNVARTVGGRAAIVTLVGDITKGVVPVLVARALDVPIWVVAAVGVGAFLGHIYSVFLRFSGGKGVATAFGVFLALAPLAAAGSVAVFFLVALPTRYVSLASMCAAAALPGLAALFGYPQPVRLAGLLIAAFVILRHRANWERLRRGVEPRFGLKR